MSSDVNINDWFTQLRLEHFLVYLPGNGWREAQEVCVDRVRFELPGGEDTFVLLLPKSNQSMQCNKLLRRAVYNLSGIEDRQPAEILRDLLSVDTSSSAPSQSGVPIRLRLRNLDATQLNVQVASRPADNSLMPGEAIEIVCHPSDGHMVEIGLKGSTVQIDDRDAT